MEYKDCMAAAQKAVLLAKDYSRDYYKESRRPNAFNEYKLDGIIVYIDDARDIKLYTKESFAYEYVKFDFIDATIEENFFQLSTLHDDNTLQMMVIFSALRKAQSPSSGFYTHYLFKTDDEI